MGGVAVRGVVLLVAVTGSSACGSCEPPARPVDAVPSATAPPLAVAPTATSSAGPWGGAAAGDELALRRLAEIHTGPELMAIARGGPQAAPALAALAHAEDGELVLAELAVLARDPERGAAALSVIVDLAARPNRAGEAADPDSLRRCIAALDALSRDSSVDRPRRVLAVNALRGFVRGGYLSADRVTTELDGS